MNFINVKSKKKETIPQKVKHFLMPEKDEELFKEVEEYNHYATYSLENSSSRSMIRPRISSDDFAWFFFMISFIACNPNCSCFEFVDSVRPSV